MLNDGTIVEHPQPEILYLLCAGSRVRVLDDAMHPTSEERARLISGRGVPRPQVVRA